jgi:hypothetical protein
MDTFQILMAIDAELAKLEQVRVLLTGHAVPSTRKPPTSVKAVASRPVKRRKLGAEARERIAAAQRARWAKTKAK